jgi:hypothetical protein
MEEEEEEEEEEEGTLQKKKKRETKSLERKRGRDKSPSFVLVRKGLI